VCSKLITAEKVKEKMYIYLGCANTNLIQEVASKPNAKKIFDEETI